MPIPKPTVEELLRASADHECHDPDGVCVRIAAVAELPTRLGDFQVVAFHSPSDGKEHAALVKGDVVRQENVPVRLHSECLTGDVFGSLRCDCREQLETSIRWVERNGLGVILYLRQEGRGIGFENKIKAYQLQEQGLDTIQANEALGFRADERDYAVAAHMLASLEIRSIRLMSNNPSKIDNLRSHGVIVTDRIPVVVAPNPHNRRYLETKRLRSGHILPSTRWDGSHEQIDSVSPASSESPSESRTA